MTTSTCPYCNYTYPNNESRLSCPLCAGKWEKWDLQFSPLPLPRIKGQIAAWLGQLPYPTAIEIAADGNGLRVRLYTPPGKGQGAIRAWAALTQQQSRWNRVPTSNQGGEQASGGVWYALHTTALLPGLAATDGDPFLAIGGQLLSLAHDDRVGEQEPETLRQCSGRAEDGGPAPKGPSSVLCPPSACSEISLRIWVLGKQAKLQERLRALAAYHYGTESGVDDDTPNPWGLRLALCRAGMVFGGMIAAIFGGTLAAGWISIFTGLLGILAGGLLFLSSFLGTLAWMKWRSIPKDTLEGSINGPLLRVSFALRLNSYRPGVSVRAGSPPGRDGLPGGLVLQANQANEPPSLELLAGEAEWKLMKNIRHPIPPVGMIPPSGTAGVVSGVPVLQNHRTPGTGALDTPEWPAIRGFSMPLPAADLAGLIAPPEAGEGSGLVDQEFRQDVPAPPPSRALVEAPFKIGMAVATGESIGVDPDGHGLATGGSRTGKSSFVFRLLKQLIESGEDAPGIFLVDPHASLADGLLHAIDQLPGELRSRAVQRLRVITPDQPEVVPLNLLAIPEFSWAGNAIIQAGRRIWDDYWGPRMQAALLGLFRLAHAWNLKHPDRCMGLLHVVFAAFNTGWRHSAMAYLDPVDRLGSLALDALLGQLSKEPGGWSQKWATEVVSPVLSKAMALELSPWLFAAMHQDRFVDLEKWVRERCWVVLRLPSGTMGREGARLTAGIFYNVFEAAFRKVTAVEPTPYYFIIDEAQEIAGGMRLEAMLSEGAKFGAHMFVLAQSLSMLRRVEGFEQVVQALLANTSTQAFFSPDPEDADLIRATLSASVRYGATTLDLPSLQAWLRARLGGRWQPPTLVTIEPLPRADPVRVKTLIREVIAAHPDDYAPGDGWQDNVVRAMEGIVPHTVRGLLDKLLTPNLEIEKPPGGEAEGKSDDEHSDQRRLGW
jgi:hypothetical protein